MRVLIALLSLVAILLISGCGTGQAGGDAASDRYSELNSAAKKKGAGVDSTQTD